MRSEDINILMRVSYNAYLCQNENEMNGIRVVDSAIRAEILPAEIG